MPRYVMPAFAVILLGLTACAGQQGGERSFRQQGAASYFRSGQGDNTKTVSGEPVNPQGLTAAHRTLPLGTRATVTNRETGRSVEVRINDRGPERTDRIIDVSERAAAELGMEKTGVAPVVVEADPSKQDNPAIQRQVGALVGGD